MRDTLPSRFDSPVEGRKLSKRAVDALRRSLRSENESGCLDADARAAIRSLCDDAHAQDLGADELLLSLKRHWERLPEVRKLPRGEHRARLLGHIATVTTCEFFAEPDPH